MSDQKAHKVTLIPATVSDRKARSRGGAFLEATPESKFDWEPLRRPVAEAF